MTSVSADGSARQAQLAHGSSTASRQVALLVFFFLFAIVVAPIVLVPSPPLVDYPNHLAMLHILVNHAGSPFLQQYYAPALSLNGNMGLVVGALPLAHVFGAELGLKIFTILVVLVLTSGVLVLHRLLHGRWSLVPCAVFLLVYNRVFLWGFLGFLFALGLAIWAIAGWIKLSDARDWIRITLGALMALVIGFAHLFALGVFGLVVGGHELVRLYRTGNIYNPRAWAHSTLIVLPLPISFLIIAALGEQAGGMAPVVWRSMFNRLEQWTGPFLGYQLAIDAATLLILAVVGLFLIASKRVVVAWPLVGGLVLLIVAQLVMPDVVGGSAMADRRVPVAWFLLAIAAVDIVHLPTRLTRALVGVVALLFALRLAVLGAQWHQWARHYAEYVEAFSLMPRGAELVGITIVSDRRDWVSLPRRHAEAYAVVLRDAFVPSLFAKPFLASSHIAYQAAFGSWVRASINLAWSRQDSAGADSVRNRALAVAPCYEYVLVNDASESVALMPTTHVEVFRGEGFRLLRHNTPHDAAACRDEHGRTVDPYAQRRT